MKFKLKLIGILLLFVSCAEAKQPPKSILVDTAYIRGQFYMGEEHYADKEYPIVIYGDSDVFVGYKALIEKYPSSLKTINLMKAYVGTAFARMRKWDEAIPYLKNFSSDDKMMNSIVEASLADCLMNTAKVKKAIPYFLESAKNLNDSTLSPLYYNKAALAYRQLKDRKNELKIFAIIKDQYPNSREAKEAQKYIDEVKSSKN